MTERVLTLTPNPALDVWTTTAKFRSGSKLRCSQPRIDPGGGGINVSRVLHRLEGDTLALFTAGGRTGEEVAARLDGFGVPAERCAIDSDTREDFSVREEESGDVLRFVTPGPELSAGEGDRLLDRLGKLAGGGELVVGSGSLPAGLDDDFWAEAVRRCKDAGARFILDSHDCVGPALDEGVFCFRENTDAVAELAGHDIAWPDEVAAWAEKQIEAGAVEMIIVTEGSEGALLVTRDTRLVLSPPEVEPRSAVGAGDSFVAGLCLALSEQRSIEDTLRQAVGTAAATLLTPGTELCRKEDVERLVSACGDPRHI
ncbi:1-phosphofructokinase family hexose kinase [Palleronia sp.]|uniref:1-phosphofructokinase family hexose kinase n=1 Tax=Palleronia sp. TaxID=1940284 RepID=UPI0035C7FF84